jgi:hypothetical protein
MEVSTPTFDGAIVENSGATVEDIVLQSSGIILPRDGSTEWL